MAQIMLIRLYLQNRMWTLAEMYEKEPYFDNRRLLKRRINKLKEKLNDIHS